jgi:Ca2+/Na+ antiporter
MHKTIYLYMYPYRCIDMFIYMRKMCIYLFQYLIYYIFTYTYKVVEDDAGDEINDEQSSDDDACLHIEFLFIYVFV